MTTIEEGVTYRRDVNEDDPDCGCGSLRERLAAILSGRICDADGCLDVNGPWVAECHRCTPSGDPS